MNRPMILAIVASALSAPVLASADPITYTCGFEPPAYALGDLSGQSGWKSTNRFANVQSYCTFTGSQALSLGSLGGIETVYRDLGNKVAASYDATVAMTAARKLMPKNLTMGGQVTLETTGFYGEAVDVRFGIRSYPGPTEKWGLFLDYVVKGDIVASVVQPVNTNFVDVWHQYSIRYLSGQGIVLSVDGVPTLKVGEARPVAMIDGIWLTTMARPLPGITKSAMFFDDFEIVSR